MSLGLNRLDRPSFSTLASGPIDPRFGGILLLRVPDEEGTAALDRIRDGDPFTQRALAQYELLPWMPVIGCLSL